MRVQGRALPGMQGQSPCRTPPAPQYVPVGGPERLTCNSCVEMPAGFPAAVPASKVRRARSVLQMLFCAGAKEHLEQQRMLPWESLNRSIPS